MIDGAGEIEYTYDVWEDNRGGFCFYEQPARNLQTPNSFVRREPALGHVLPPLSSQASRKHGSMRAFGVYGAGMNRRMEILRMRLEDRLTLREIADHFGISHQRVHQVIGYPTSFVHDKHKERKMNLSEKVWSRVNKLGPDDCWEYMGAKTAEGYGHVHFMYVDYYAHRVVYEYIFGPYPDELHVLHRCDNPPCCNPDHLFLGTHQDNIRDRDEKGRCAAVGVKNWSSKLNPVQVRKMRDLFSTGRFSYAEIGRKFGVHRVTAYNVIARKRWKHVD